MKEKAWGKSVPRYLQSAIAVFTLLLFGCKTALAQTVQFVPETDIHVALTSHWKTYLEAKDDQDAGESKQLGIGPSVQLYLKPLVTLKNVTAFDLDESKKRVFVLETGYRYITNLDAPPTNRMETVATLNFPMKANFLIQDRNRADLDWKSGVFSWRYRNKLSLERTVGIHRYHLIPYVAVEPYYTSEYSKWSTTALYAGCLLPVRRWIEFNPYYEHENNTGKKPNQPQDAIGLAVYFYSSLHGR